MANAEKSREYDLIVIGAGPGGATLASLAANEGKKVLVVDKNPAAGGRMMTVHRDGHSYEMFPLNLVPYAPSLFEELQERVGKTVRNVTVGVEDAVNPIYIAPDGKVTLIDVKSLSVLKSLGLRNPVTLIRTALWFRRVMTMKEKEILKLGGVSAYDYMQRQKFPDILKVFITAAMGEGAFEMSSDLVPASSMIRMIQLAMDPKRTQQRYYEGGIGGFFSRMLERVPENGGDLLYSTRVSKVIVENGRAAGVVTAAGDEYRAPVVASSAGIRQTVRFLVGEEHFPAEYAERVRNLRSNLCDVGYRYFTTRKILPCSTYVLFPYDCLEPWSAFEEMAAGRRKPKGNYIYLGTKSIFPTIGPEDGRQVIYAVMSCVPDMNQDFSPYLEYIERRVAKVFPELYEEGAIERKEVMSLQACAALGVDPVSEGRGGESYGIAACIGQADAQTPKTETPVPGLYIVGNDAEGFGLGTHRAVDSGFKVFEKIRDRL